MKVSSVVLALLVSVIVPVAVADDCPTPYAYSGFAGPEQWVFVPGARLCGEGKEQSPIDLANFVPKNGKPVMVGWGTVPTVVENSGHDFRVTLQQGSTSGISVGTDRYRLLNMHMHVPAEHWVLGSHPAAEIHFVHESTVNKGQIAVIAIFLREAPETDPILRPFFAALAPELCKSKKATEPLRLGDLLPKQINSYLTYDGSLTTPPCSQDVRFYIVHTMKSVSKADLALLATFGENARPLQPSEGHTVYLVSNNPPPTAP
ncbi:MAG: caa [Acidobacteria bacterium]|nr:caa [Acidobacteriota bacterium]